MPVLTRILLVSASSAEVQRHEKYLSNQGYEVQDCTDGADALERIRNFEPHLVLLDADLTEDSAFVVCKQIKQDPMLKNTMVVIAVAFGGLGDIERAVEAGTDDFLSKPVNEADLLKRVDGLLKLVGGPTDSPGRPIDLALKRIRRAVECVQRDPFTPAVVSSEVADYLRDLAVEHPHDDSNFSNFVLSLPYGAIRRELLDQLVPHAIRRSVRDCRAELEAVQRSKEDGIAQGNFDKAAECRDQQKRLAMRIQGLVADYRLTVTPEVIASTLKSLGYHETSR